MVESLLYHKGVVGEDLFSVLFIIILIFVFIAALHYTYINYINVQDIVERTRTAATVAEWIYFTNNGTITDIDCNNLKWRKVYVLFYKKNSQIGACPSVPSSENTVLSSMPINFVGTNGWEAGKVEVYVEK